MLTKHQARKLRELIRRFADAQEADSWKGGGDPDETPAIERELAEAWDQLSRYIRKLVQDRARAEGDLPSVRRPYEQQLFLVRSADGGGPAEEATAEAGGEVALPAGLHVGGGEAARLISHEGEDFHVSEGVDCLLVRGTTSDTTHSVFHDLSACSCPDNKYRERECKHIRALRANQT